jgi:GH24 family phage-related lysozyme (muramidase)
MLKITPALVEMVGEFEGFRAELYNDAANHATIGFGHLVHLGPIHGGEPANFQRGISREEALEMLRNDLANAETQVNERVTVPLKAHQYDALVSFAFNVGRGHFADSALLERLNGGEYDSVPSEMRRWVFAGGRPLLGLIRRRQREGTLFARGIYQAVKPGEYINQEIINAFARAETKLELPLWTLLRRTGMTPEGLAAERRALYQGVPIDRLPHLTGEERKAIQAELPDAIAPFEPEGSRGFGDFLSHSQRLAEVALPADTVLTVPSGAEPLAGRVVRAWNQYGGLLTAIADELGLDLALAVGVLACAKGRLGEPPLPSALYSLLGYETAAHMTQTFARDARFPIIGLFDLIAGAKGESRQVEALRVQAWEPFAALHYGADRAEAYARRLEYAVAWFTVLMNDVGRGTHLTPP